MIDSDELTKDESIQRKFLLSGMSMLSKVITGKATKSETEQAHTAKSVLKVKDKSCCERFAILREDFQVVGKFFFEVEDMRFIDDARVSTSRHEEYLGELDDGMDEDDLAADDESEYSGNSDD